MCSSGEMSVTFLLYLYHRGTKDRSVTLDPWVFLGHFPLTGQPESVVSGTLNRECWRKISSSSNSSFVWEPTPFLAESNLEEGNWCPCLASFFFFLFPSLLLMLSWARITKVCINFLQVSYALPCGYYQVGLVTDYLRTIQYTKGEVCDESLRIDL